LGSMITNDARCTREIKSRIAMAKAAFKKLKNFHHQTEIKFKKDISEKPRLDYRSERC